VEFRAQRVFLRVITRLGDAAERQQPLAFDRIRVQPTIQDVSDWSSA
jgi:hypothetical protein